MWLVLFFGLPAAAFVWFIVCLVSRLKCAKDSENLRQKTRMAIVSGIVFGVMFVSEAAIIAVILIGIANM
ncbi:MAG: hypothetical protein LUI05_02955 [Oscillospiraceae bacterium]|nr:hypothetical protein [Oscillospiraceae bacterium]